MVPKHCMLIAGEASGDLLAAELVQALRDAIPEREAGYTPELQPLHTSLEPRFFGAGGPRMAAAGVELACDLTAHAVVGLSEVLRHYFTFRRIFQQLLQMARMREPQVIICVDFSGFNLRFAHAIKQHLRHAQHTFYNWTPRIVQYVSPQVWASRPARAARMEQDLDLLLATFPFEPDWYALRAPRLPVQYVGHPVLDRYAGVHETAADPERVFRNPERPLVLLLPGSRRDELRRHVPVFARAVSQLETRHALQKRMVLPDAALAEFARSLLPLGLTLEIQVGNLGVALAQADLAIASTGTVTMECAYFGVPTVAVYKTSPTTYQVGKRLVTVSYLAMPNLLAGQPLYPEFIQHAATPENIAAAALELLMNSTRRREVKLKLSRIIRNLGPPGAARRAAQAILQLLEQTERSFPLRAHLY